MALNLKLQAPPDLKIGPNNSQITILNDQDSFRIGIGNIFYEKPHSFGNLKCSFFIIRDKFGPPPADLSL